MFKLLRQDLGNRLRNWVAKGNYCFAPCARALHHKSSTQQHSAAAKNGKDFISSEQKVNIRCRNGWAFFEKSTGKFYVKQKNIKLNVLPVLFLVTIRINVSLHSAALTFSETTYAESIVYFSIIATSQRCRLLCASIKRESTDSILTLHSTFSVLQQA